MRQLRWNCKERGKCFRRLCPKLGEFDDLFPRSIGMSDIDGAVEMGGRFLFLEWKSKKDAIPLGQHIMFEQITKISQDPERVIVMVVRGDPDLMTVDELQVYRSGEKHPAEKMDMEGLQRRIKHWSQNAQEAKWRQRRSA